VPKSLIFAGAGASTAVNRTAFPTTRDFFEKHTQDFQMDALFQRVVRFIRDEKVKNGWKSDKGNEQPPVDLEEILFVLGEVEETFRRFTQQSGHAAFAVAHSEFMPHGMRGTSVTQAFESTAPSITSLRHGLNRTLHKVYRGTPDISELRNNWLPLLEVAQSKSEMLDVFTTNYDFVIETALDFLPEPLVDKGHFTTPYNTLGLSIWENRAAWRPKKKGLFTKLHGSLNWTPGEDGEIEIGGPTPREPDKQVAIYPGFKGSPDSEPFATFHDYLAQRMREADSIVFIGFAFRDQFLNSVFSSAIKAGTHVLVVDPCASTLNIPKGIEVERIAKGFNESIDELVRFFDNTIA
jgi:hypothetical protein